MKKIIIPILFVLVIALAFFLNSISRPSEFASYLLLYNCNLITMKNDSIIENQAIVVKDRIIIDIGETSRIQQRYKNIKNEINCENKYVLPGLTDLHIHTNNWWEVKALNVHPVDLYASYGITTIRNGENFSHFENYSDLITSYRLDEINYIHSYTDTQEYQKNQDHTKCIKVKYKPSIQDLDPEIWYLWGHITQLKDINEISKLSEISHLRQITKTDSEQVIEIIKQNNIIVNTTFIVLQEILNRYNKGIDEYTDYEKSLLSGPFLNYIDTKWKLNPHLNFIKTDDDYVTQQNMYKTDADIFKQLMRESVILLSCTDSGFYYHGTIPGKSLHQEFEILDQLGLSPYEILKTNTYNAYLVSNRMKLNEKFGIIDIGCRADILVVNKNPFNDISNLKDIYGVMTAGQWKDRQQLLAIE